MRFTLVDRILELVPGQRITAVKNLSLAEEYLADHFPGFPVMPGVLMLEAMTQSAAWLIRASEDFAHAVVVLKEARNVKYASFVEPAETLTLTVELLSQDERLVKVKAEGRVGERQTVSARLTLERFNRSADDPSRAESDARVVREMRELYALLKPPEPQPREAVGA